MTPNDALQHLIDGNRRYAAGRPLHAHHSAAERRQVAERQHPFAVVLGCADSRVPVEVVFDQGLGDLFVVRSAGQVLDDAIVGSIELAVREFGVPLVLVLGHERCGAVQAALDVVPTHGEPLGHVDWVLRAIRPAVRTVAGHPGDALQNAVRANVEMVAGALRSSEPVLAKRVRGGALRVVGADYHLDDGLVQIVAP
jgi:carbonic anhydrase